MIKRHITLFNVLIVLLVGWILFRMQPDNYSAGYSGPAFRARSGEEGAEVWSGLHHQLESMGFREMPGQPSPAMAREVDAYLRFVKHGPGKRTLRVELVKEDNTLSTMIGWHARCWKKNARIVSHDAATVALTLDDWFRARMETNLIPPESRDETTKSLKRTLTRPF